MALDKTPNSMCAPPLRLDEAAARLGVSKRTLQRWITEGAIACIRYGERYVRVPVSAIESFEKNYLSPVKSPKSGGLADLLDL